MSGEGIGCTVLVTRLVVNFVVVVCQQLQPLHLLSIENTRLHKVFEILVVITFSTNHYSISVK